MSDRRFLERVEERVREWGVAVESTLETESSFVAFGTSGDKSVVLKVVRRPGDEWHSGKVLEAFGGDAIVRVYKYIEGAVLLERLSPGTQLADLSLDNRDEEATEILARAIRRLSHPGEPAEGFVTVEKWGESFRRYLAGADERIPRRLVEEAERIYLELCGSQRDIKLLHGDLQHYNILFDSNRGWVAIDPKGVVGEIEYEIGAALRNPFERPDLFASAETVNRRLRQFEAVLKLNFDRALKWGFAQAVLSAVWSAEDGFAVEPDSAAMRLARVMRGML